MRSWSIFFSLTFSEALSTHSYSIIMFLRSVLSKRVGYVGLRFMSQITRPAISAFPRFQSCFIQPIQPQINTITIGQSPMDTAFDSIEPALAEDNTMYMDSVMRKRRLKMKKHKLRKRRKEQRSLKKRLGKI